MLKIHSLILLTRKVVVRLLFLVVLLTFLSLIFAKPSFAQASNNGTFDILFVAEDYAPADLALFSSDVAMMYNKLLTYEPFSARKDKIKYDIIPNTEDLECQVTTTDTGLQRVTCNVSKLLIMVNNSGKDWDKIVLVINRKPYVTSRGNVAGSALEVGGVFAYVTSQEFGSDTFVHELGHTLGLRDESPTQGAAPAEKLDNKTYDNCYAGPTLPNPDWEGIPDIDYQQGCVFSNWYRSTKTSFMNNTFSRYFNEVSKRIINQNLDGFMGVTPEPISTLTVFAAGKPYTDISNNVIYPQMEIWVYGVKVATYEVGGDWNAAEYPSFTYTAPSKIVPDAVRVFFTNDGTNLLTGETSSLFVDGINIDGRPYPTKSPVTYMEGYYQNGSCQSGFLIQKELGCNGFFQFQYGFDGVNSLVDLVNDPSLVGYWKMDEPAWAPDCSTLSVIDSSVNGNHGQGCLGGSSPLGGAIGKFTNAGYFAGKTDYVKIPGGGGLNGATEGTISMWAKWSGAQDRSYQYLSYGNILGRQKDSNWSDNVIGLSTADPNTAKVNFLYKGPSAVRITGSTIVGDNRWRHVVVTFTSGSQKLYVDGVLDGSSTITGGLDNDPNIPLTIGAWIGAGHGYSKGHVDDVRIYNRVFSPSEVSQLYSNVPSEALTSSITWDSTSKALINTVPGQTWSHTVGAGSNRLLLVGLSSNFGQGAQSVSYAGQALTKAGLNVGGATRQLSEIWYLVNPPTGTNNISFTYNPNPTYGQTGSAVAASATSWFGVNQSSPLRPYAGATSGGYANRLSVPSERGDMVVDVITELSILHETIYPHPDQSQKFQQDITTIKAAGSSRVAGPTSTMMSWTFPSSHQSSLSGVAIKPAQ